ncbi:uncharacterized protein LOC141533369 isoform X3 [Cotesia typhae]|uniref:uncharacterized protein LOC141533369 isoform X3 n=1 Tax=Cotesia typhae TaxID=2053667 RepID=UPI003D6835E1
MPTVSPRCVIPRAKNFKVQTLKMTIQPPIVAQPSRQNVISDNLLQYGAEDLQEDDYKSCKLPLSVFDSWAVGFAFSSRLHGC